MSNDAEIPDEISFDEWVTHVFDHDDSRWHWSSDAPYWNHAANPSKALEFLDQLFSAPEFLVERFTPDQIGTGFNFLADPSHSDYSFVLLDHQLPVEGRTRCVRHIATIYEKVFARVCVNLSKHGRWSPLPEATSADNICYMFWDVFPMYGRTRSNQRHDADVEQNWESHCRIEDACLTAMERSLAIDHHACQEGALHGLGHWQMYYPERVEPIIDAYLSGNGAKSELYNYARSARQGQVQ